MEIKMWGCRGSMPTPGYSTLKYGGNSTCVEVRLSDGTLIIIDAGTGIKWLGDILVNEKGLCDIFIIFTHAHWDHIIGFPFFEPAYLDRFNIHMRGGLDANESIRKFLSHEMMPPYFPVKFSECRANFDILSGENHVKQIGSAEIIPINLNHPDGGHGYKIIDNHKSFVFLTDNELGSPHPGGLGFDDYASFSENCDLLIHDAQYSDEEMLKKKGWGHSSISDTCTLASKAGVKNFGMTHYDPTHSDEILDGFSELCRDWINQTGNRPKFITIKEGLRIKL